jgi:hypothetical protein
MCRDKTPSGKTPSTSGTTLSARRLLLHSHRLQNLAWWASGWLQPAEVLNLLFGLIAGGDE